MTTAIDTDIQSGIRSGIRLTLAEFLDLPEMEQRCELIDGVLRMAAFPIPDHQFPGHCTSHPPDPANHGGRAWDCAACDRA